MAGQRFRAWVHARLARDKIVVTTVSPGLTRTGSPPRADVKGNHEAEHTSPLTAATRAAAERNNERVH